MSELSFLEVDMGNTLEQLAYHCSSLKSVFSTAAKENIILKRTEETCPSGMEVLLAREDFALVQNYEDHFDERNNTEPYINPYGTNVAIRVKE